jgi:hypothetical protein
MKYWKISVLPMVLASILFILLFCSIVSGLTQEEVMKKIEALQKEYEQTTDPARLQEIQNEMLQLTQELLKSQGMGLGNISPLSASTPEEEVKRFCEITNTQGAQLKSAIAQGTISGAEQRIPVPHAVPLEGYSVIDGKYESKPYRGWVWEKVKYNVVERFVGYIVVTEYYDTKKKKYDKDNDYLIHTISTAIEVKSFSGRECKEASAELPGHCTKWENYSHYKIYDENRYPSLYDYVALGGSEEGKMEFKVMAPNVNFLSDDEKASASIGCGRADFEMSTEEFGKLMKSGKIDLKKGVSSLECNKGSSIEVHIKIKPSDCSIKFLDNRNGIYGCGKPKENPTVDVSLEAHLKSGTPVSYQWKILSGADIVEFSGGNSTSKKVKLHPISYSKMPNDVTVEVAIKNSKGHTCVVCSSLTVQKPSSLSMLSESEVKALGLEPYVNYQAKCAQGDCEEMPVEMGKGKKKIIDGYMRIVVFQVLDQFDLPITQPELFWKEKRWVMIDNKKIDLPYLDEGKTVEVPVNPDHPYGPAFKMYSNNDVTEYGGKIIDRLAVMYAEGTNGVPTGFDITVQQDVTCFGCPAGHVVQHYKEKDATATYSKP